MMLRNSPIVEPPLNKRLNAWKHVHHGNGGTARSIITLSRVRQTKVCYAPVTLERNRLEVGYAEEDGVASPSLEH